MKRIFKLKDQITFSKLSGDFNPIHLDKEWARKEYPGEIVIYGVLILLWAIESTSHQNQISMIKARFIQPALLNDELDLEKKIENDKQIILISIRKNLVARFELLYDKNLKIKNSFSISKFDSFTYPKKLSFEELVIDKGIVYLSNRDLELSSIYPNSSKYLGDLALKGLLNISRLVGMYCPGLRSIFSTIDISIISNPKDLEYNVIKANRKLGYSKINVNGLNLNGTVSAYFTEDYIEEEIELKNIKSNNYKDSSALVIGSSGLGRVVSNILLENNGKVVLTSRNLKKKNNLNQNIVNYCPNLTLMELDIEEKDSINSFFKDLKSPIKSLYYFPSPRIFRRRLKEVSSKDLNDFLNIYVFKYIQFVEMFLNSGKCGNKLIIGYPSSVAINQKLTDQFEYYSAKKIGEYACDLLLKKFKSLDIVIKRFPRLSTRQTNSFLKVETENSSDVMKRFVKSIESKIN